MQKKPTEIGFLSHREWGQILATTQSAIYEDLHFGRFYKKYQIDEPFIDESLQAQLVMTPGRWAANVREALEPPGPGTGVV
jgi:hypothetical protein